VNEVRFVTSEVYDWHEYCGFAAAAAELDADPIQVEVGLQNARSSYNEQVPVKQAGSPGTKLQGEAFPADGDAPPLVVPKHLTEEQVPMNCLN
jgi:hypothetical protein